MTTWRYRVIKHVKGDEVTYGIHEVYYGDDKTTPEHWTEKPVSVSGDNLEDLAWALEKMTQALTLPIFTPRKDSIK